MLNKKYHTSFIHPTSATKQTTNIYIHTVHVYTAYHESYNMITPHEAIPTYHMHCITHEQNIQKEINRDKYTNTRGLQRHELDSLCSSHTKRPMTLLDIHLLASTGRSFIQRREQMKNWQITQLCQQQ